MQFTIRFITQKSEMLDLFSLIHQLNPRLNELDFRSRIEEMFPMNYGMAGVFDGDHCVAVSGYWIATKLYSGKYMELDNVVVHRDYRSKGLGKMLSDFLEKYALQQNCLAMMLDAYLENEAGHRFYEREGFVKKGFHFVKELRTKS